MIDKKDLVDLRKLIDNYAVILVSHLCKRAEVIEKTSVDKKSSELIKLYPYLFKELSKELVYENSRALKRQIEISLIPDVVYRKRH